MTKVAPILTSMFLFLSMGLMAQMVTNGSLEYWEVQDENASLLLKENPKGWTTRNQLEVNPQAIFCYKTTDSFNGVRAAVLQNYTTNSGVNQSAFLSLGSYNMNTPQKRGVAFTARPYSLHFVYKYFTNDINPNGFYNAKAKIELSKWDEASGVRKIVGRGEYLISHKVSFYEPKEVVVEYFSEEEPDSLQIVFSTPNNPDDQVRFTIDDIYLQMEQTTVGADDRLYFDQVSVFPNPAKDVLNFLNPLDVSDASLLVYNSIGQLLLEEPLSGTGGGIDIQRLSDGMYFYQIRRSDELVKTGKLLKRDL